MTLTLVEALCGFQKIIKTLDERDLLITSPLGSIIEHGDLKSIANEGMPVYRDPFTKGKLTIHFTVKFPRTIDPEIIPKLEAFLPPREQIIVPDGAEEVLLEDVDLHAERNARMQQARDEAYDEDKREFVHGPCATH